MATITPRCNNNMSRSLLVMYNSNYVFYVINNVTIVQCYIVYIFKFYVEDRSTRGVFENFAIVGRYSFTTRLSACQAYVLHIKKQISNIQKSKALQITNDWVTYHMSRVNP